MDQRSLSQDQGQLPSPNIGQCFTIRRSNASSLGSHWAVLQCHKINRLCPCLALARTSLFQSKGLPPLPGAGSFLAITRSRASALAYLGSYFAIVTLTASAFASHWIIVHHHKINGICLCIALGGTPTCQRVNGLCTSRALIPTSLLPDELSLPLLVIGSCFTITRPRFAALG